MKMKPLALWIAATAWIYFFLFYDFPTPAEKAQKSVAIVETPTGWGSAVAFKVPGNDRVFFLTAKHVVEKAPSLKIRVESHRRGFKAGHFEVPAQVVLLSTNTDAAILTIPPVEWDFVGAKIERALPHVGDSVLAVGNPHGANFDRSVSSGIISQQGVFAQDYPNFPWPLVDQTDAHNLPGSSGGAVFGSSGRLLGIQVGNVDNGVFLYLPARVLLADAHAEGWGWLFGDGKITEKEIAELIAKVPKPAPEPPVFDIGKILQGLGHAIIPNVPEKPVTPTKPKGLNPDLKKGHR